MKKMDNLMAAVKMAKLSEVNHGKCEHTALGRGLSFSLCFVLPAPFSVGCFTCFSLLA